MTELRWTSAVPAVAGAYWRKYQCIDGTWSIDCIWLEGDFKVEDPSWAEPSLYAGPLEPPSEPQEARADG